MKNKPAKPKFKMPTITITRIQTEASHQEIRDDNNHFVGAIMFEPKLTLQTKPRLSMKGICSIIINGVEFCKPYEL